MSRDAAVYDVRADLPMRLYRDDVAGVWVSACDVLGVLSQGETKEQAIEALSEAVELFARNCDARGLRPTFAPAEVRMVPDIHELIAEAGEAYTGEALSIEEAFRLLIGERDAYRKGQDDQERHADALVEELAASGVALDNISGALVDSGVVVPEDVTRYGEAVREIVAERDRLAREFEAAKSRAERAEKINAEYADARKWDLEALKNRLARHEAVERERNAELQRADAAEKRVGELAEMLRLVREHGIPSNTLSELRDRIDAALAAPASPATAKESHCEARVPFSEGDACGNPMPCEVHPLCTAACPPFQPGHSTVYFHSCQLESGHGGPHQWECVNLDSHTSKCDHRDDGVDSWCAKCGELIDTRGKP